MWLAALIPLLSSMFGENGPLGQYFKTKAAQVQADANLALQIQKDKLALSSIIAQAAVDSERNKLAATSQTFKAVSFLLLNIPIIITCLSNIQGEALWNNLTLIPVWYAQMYVAVVFVIWGLPVVGNATGTIFNAVQQAWEVRNRGKIDKIQAIGEANGMNTEQAKKEIFDVMKKATGLQGYTQQSVDVISPVLDKVLQIQKEANK
jgi:hypothetical protein